MKSTKKKIPQWEKEFDQKFPKSRGKEYDHLEGEKNYTFLKCIPTGPRSWKLISARAQVKTFIRALLTPPKK